MSSPFQAIRLRLLGVPRARIVDPDYHGPAMSRPARVAFSDPVILTSVEVE